MVQKTLSLKLKLNAARKKIHLLAAKRKIALHVLRRKILAAPLATALRKLKASTKIAATRTNRCLDKNKKLTLTVSFFSLVR